MNIMNLKSSCSSWWNHYLGTPSCLINQEKSGLTLLVVPTLWPTQQQNCLKNCVGWILITGMLQRQRFCTITESIHGIVCRQGRSTNKPTQNLRNLTPNPRHPRVVFSHHQTKPSSWWHVLGPHPSQVTHFKRNAWLNGGIMRIWMEYSWDMNGILMTCPPEIFDIAMKDGWQWPMEWPMEFHGLLSLLIKWWFSIPKRQPPRVSNEELDLIDTISPKLGFHHGGYGSEGGGYFCS